MKPIFPAILLLFVSVLTAAEATNPGKFEQIDLLLPAPSEVRLATGAPGPAYWQQEANYFIEVELDEKQSRIEGSGVIEYVNHSPHTLNYLWVQLDQNTFAQDSKRQRSQQAPHLTPEDGKPRELEYGGFRTFLYNQEFEGGYELSAVTDVTGAPLNYTVVNTNMRIELDSPLASGKSFSFKVSWAFNLQDEAMAMRHGRKQLKSGDYIYQVAQWYPRMCAYYDQTGWQTKPYIGHGEFALEFGNFEVHITVPEDFVVAATGSLMNANDVLSETIQDRLKNATSSEQPVMIVTEDEAETNLKRKERGTKTWKFEAEQVRDFAFAGSRGYLWDAIGVKVDGKTIMAMSLYPAEAEAIWKRYSTEAVAQTLSVYSEEIYPYP